MATEDRKRLLAASSATVHLDVFRAGAQGVIDGAESGGPQPGSLQVPQTLDPARIGLSLTAFSDSVNLSVLIAHYAPPIYTL